MRRPGTSPFAGCLLLRRRSERTNQRAMSDMHEADARLAPFRPIGERLGSCRWLTGIISFGTGWNVAVTGDGGGRVCLLSVDLI